MLRAPTVSALLGLALLSCHPAKAPNAAELLPAQKEAPAMPAEKTPAAPSGNNRRNTDPDLTALLAGTDASVLIHTIDPRAHNVLNGWMGTTVTFPPNSLLLADSSEPDGPVTITLKEFYTPAQMIGGHISTSTFDRLLETAGSVFVGARSGTQACVLRPGTLLDIEFPYEQKRPAMQLFAGLRHQGQLNWNAIYDLKSGSRFTRSAALPAAHRVGVGYYSFHCPLLGLLSCSRLMEDAVENTTLTIEAGPMSEGAAYLLFQNSNSLLEAEVGARGARFEGVPAGEPATLVFTRRQGRQLYLAVARGIVGGNELTHPDFKAVSLPELQQQLRNLSRKEPPEKGSVAHQPMFQAVSFL